MHLGICRRWDQLWSKLTCDFEANKRPKFGQGLPESFDAAATARKRNVDLVSSLTCTGAATYAQPCLTTPVGCGYASIVSLFFFTKHNMNVDAQICGGYDWTLRVYTVLITRLTQTCFIAAKRKCICFSTISFMPCHMQNQSTYTNKILHRSKCFFHLLGLVHVQFFRNSLNQRAEFLGYRFNPSL